VHVCSWVLLSFSVLLGSDGVDDLLGIFVGHLYYFLEDVYPRMLPSRSVPPAAATGSRSRSESP